MKRRHVAVLAIAWVIAIGTEKSLLTGPMEEMAWWFQLPGFVAVFGFLSCLGLAFFAKALGQYWLQRHERYYHQEHKRHE